MKRALLPEEVEEFDRRIQAIGDEMQAHVEAAHASKDPIEARRLLRLAGLCMGRIRRVPDDIREEGGPK